jgi:hypothetical protein
MKYTKITPIGVPSKKIIVVLSKKELGCHQNKNWGAVLKNWGAVKKKLKRFNHFQRT